MCFWFHIWLCSWFCDRCWCLLWGQNWKGLKQRRVSWPIPKFNEGVVDGFQHNWKIRRYNFTDGSKLTEHLHGCSKYLVFTSFLLNDSFVLVYRIQNLINVKSRQKKMKGEGSLFLTKEYWIMASAIDLNFLSQAFFDFLPIPEMTHFTFLHLWCQCLTFIYVWYLLHFAYGRQIICFNNCLSKKKTNLHKLWPYVIYGYSFTQMILWASK